MILSSRHIWIALNVALLALFYVGLSITNLEHQRAIDNDAESSRNKLKYLSVELERQLRQKNYQSIDGFVKNWGHELSDVQEVTLTAANGFVIGHYKSDVAAEYITEYRAEIDYSYESHAALILRMSTDEIVSHRTRINTYLLAGFISLTALLYFMVHTLLRLRESGSQLRQENRVRKKAEIALQEREQQLEMTLYSIGDGIIATDAQGRVSHMNPVAESLTGWSEKQAIGNKLPDVFNIINAVTREPVDNPVETVLQRGEIIGLANHTVLISRSGTEYQIADSAAPIKDANGKIFGAILVFRDVTEEYRMQQELASKENFQQQMLDGMLTFLAILDPEGNILFVNKAGMRVVDPELQQVTGRKLYDIGCWDYSEENRQLVKSDLEKSRTDEVVARDIQLMASDGSLMWVELHISRIQNERGELERLIAEARDITVRKNAEEVLRRGQKMEALGKLTGGIAHDFNNMLGVIMGYAEMLVAGLQSQPALAKYATEIQRSGERGARLTRKLLAFTRNKQAETGVVDINTVVSEELHMLEKTLTPKIELHTELEQGLWLTQIDKGDLEDAILNVCINAMHAMPDGGSLTLSTKNINLDEVSARAFEQEAGDFVELSVIDTGTGMDKETQSLIFDPFFTTKEDGTGLGLSQVYGFVQSVGGTVKVYSEPGRGTRITFWFPRHKDIVSIASGPVKPEMKEIAPGNETILVVDDEKGLRSLARDILETRGYRVLVAENASDALQLLEQEHVDLMLSDVIMPGMDGYMLANKVQQRFPGIKIQMVSGFSDDRHLELVDTRLHTALLRKPYSSVELLGRIRELLDDKDIAGRQENNNISARSMTLELSKLLEWGPEMELGVPAIDSEHKKLHDLLKRCYICMNDDCDYSTIKAILDELLDYTKYHFMHEEMIMDVCGYPHIKNHKSVHQMLIKHVKKHIIRYEQNRFSMQDLLNLLEEWFFDHNMSMDRAVAECAKGREAEITRALESSKEYKPGGEKA